MAPAEDGEFRTRPPGIFGGNMDVRELCSRRHSLSARVQNRGALFSPVTRTPHKATAKFASMASSAR